MHRIRFAMTPDGSQPRLKGIIEADETYVGGKPRPGTGPHKRGRGTKKTPVFAMVERDGLIRRRVMPNVSGRTLKFMPLIPILTLMHLASNVTRHAQC